MSQSGPFAGLVWNHPQQGLQPPELFHTCWGVPDPSHTIQKRIGGLFLLSRDLESGPSTAISSRLTSLAPGRL